MQLAAVALLKSMCTHHATNFTPALSSEHSFPNPEPQLRQPLYSAHSTPFILSLFNMSSLLLRVAVENRMKISRDAEEQRRAPRNQNQRPPPPPTSPNKAHRIMHIVQGSPNPDADQGKPQPSQQNSGKRFWSSRLAGESLRRAQFALENYNPPLTRSSLESSANSSAYVSSTRTADTSPDCSDTESEVSMEEMKTHKGISSGAAPRFNPSLVPTTSTLAYGCREKEEEEERRIEAFYEAISLNLPHGTIYVTYLNRLPADWQRPLYQCEDRDCTFHNGVNTNKTVSTCRARPTI